jgi:hypothetical protein
VTVDSAPTTVLSLLPNPRRECNVAAVLVRSWTRERIANPKERPMTRIPAAVLGASLTLAACGGAPQSAVPAEAQKAAAAVTGDAGVAAADNPQCKLFTAVEIAKYIGEPVSPGQNAALGTGCQWLAADGTGDVIVAVVPSSYHEPPTGAAGYRALADVGSKGFVAPQLDGWVAGAIVGEDAIRVSVAGATASDATAVSLLQDTIRRRAS